MLFHETKSQTLKIVWGTTKTLPREDHPTKFSESVRSTLLKATTNKPTSNCKGTADIHNQGVHTTSGFTYHKFTRKCGLLCTVATLQHPNINQLFGDMLKINVIS